jgi:hypothetical protein
MLCDWIGAGKAIMGAKANTPMWYQNNKANIILHPAIREWVEYFLFALEYEKHHIG